jgi:hypothetical protein
MAKGREIGQTNGVRMGQYRFCAVAVLILLGTLSVSASTTGPSESRPPASVTALQGPSFSDEMAAVESLREDVGRHPNEFVIFETRIAANRFIAQHEGAYHETEGRVVLRGVIGYWQGKTVVVLPSLAIGDPL